MTLNGVSFYRILHMAAKPRLESPWGVLPGSFGVTVPGKTDPHAKLARGVLTCGCSLQLTLHSK